MISAEESELEQNLSKSKLDSFGFPVNQQKQNQQNKQTPQKLKQKNARLEKWRNMLPNLQQLQKNKDKQLKQRIRKGIPAGIRFKAWPILAKIPELKKENPQINFDALKKSKHFPYEGDIQVDLPRTFPDHQLFSKNSIVNAFNSAKSENVGLKSLMDILKALSLTYDKMGYCQGINFLGASFLIHMNDEESFWMLFSLMKNYNCIEMYQNVATIHKQLYVHGKLVEQFLPTIHKHLETLQIQHVYYGVNWYMTLFSGYLPFHLFLRVFDIFLNEGWKIIYRVGMTVLKIKQKNILKSKFENVMDAIRDMSDLESIEEDEFIKIANEFIFSKKLIEKHLADYEKDHPETTARENTPKQIN